MNYTIKSAEVELRGQEIFLHMTIDVVQKVEVDPHFEMNLTRRELELLPMLSAGLANKQIAEKLNISERTVKAHVSNVLQKTGSLSRHELARRMTYVNLDSTNGQNDDQNRACGG